MWSCRAFVIGASVFWNLQVDCKRIDNAKAIKLIVDAKHTLESGNQSQNSTEISLGLHEQAHEKVLEKYQLQCRCTRACTKKNGSFIRGEQSCKVERAGPDAGKNKGTVCAPGTNAYEEHCQELIQPVVTLYDRRCERDTPQVMEDELKTSYPQDVGEEVQTNTLTFGHCVEEVLRRSREGKDERFLKRKQLKISANEEVPITIGVGKSAVTITMPACRCKKVWIKEPLVDEDVDKEGRNWLGCSKDCKERTGHTCQKPSLTELSNVQCQQKVKEYCANRNASGKCTQTWKCVHQGECDESQREPTKTSLESEQAFLSQCHKCCETKFSSSTKISGIHNTAGSPPTKERKWITGTSPCSGSTTKTKAGHNGHGQFRWTGYKKVLTDVAKSSCGGWYGGHFDYPDDYSYRDSYSDDEC